MREWPDSSWGRLAPADRPPPPPPTPLFPTPPSRELGVGGLSDFRPAAATYFNMRANEQDRVTFQFV